MSSRANRKRARRQPTIDIECAARLSAAMALPYDPTECDAFNATLNARLFPDDPVATEGLLSTSGTPGEVRESDGAWYVWEPNHRNNPVSDVKAALLAYAARPRRPQRLIVSRDLFEKAKRLGLLDESEDAE